MISVVACIILVAISCLVLFYSLRKVQQAKSIQAEKFQLTQQTRDKQERLERQISEQERHKQHLMEEISAIETSAAAAKQLSSSATDNYLQVLENSMTKAEKQYQDKLNNLDKSYEQEKAELKNQIQQTKDELKKVKEILTAVREAEKRVEDIQQNKEDYMLIPDANDLRDMRILEEVKKKLAKPRILSMLIWQSYWQPLAKKQFPKILGTDKTVIGIYKITNQVTNECYIGQSVDVDKRWKDHIKCGLGIDTPVGNKLYQAMKQFGIQSFSFEVLAQCKREELDEREKFFIGLYGADSFGYNSTAGNSGNGGK